jgi:3-hydroxypropanoate dehydrogenase
MKSISKDSMDQLFTNARTHNGWMNETVTDDTLHRIYDLFKWGPTSANSSPGRVLFVKTPIEKAKLLNCMAPGNLEKTQSAPVTAIMVCRQSSAD